jgi:hypothetical protein
MFIQTIPLFGISFNSFLPDVKLSAKRLLDRATIDIFINNFTTKDMNWKTVVTSTESLFGTPDSYRERSHIYWPGAGCAISHIHSK